MTSTSSPASGAAPAGRATGRRVQFMATCLCDAFYDEAAAAAVEVLETAGCEVSFPEDQTCCGQPAFNAGDWAASRRVVRHMLRAFPGEDPVVVPSASCAAMVFHGALLAFEGEPDLAQVQALARRTWELCDFLVNGLEAGPWSGRWPGRVALHRSCHARGTGTIPAALHLLSGVEGLEVLPLGEEEQCCGFGGTFSVAFPAVSKGMGQLKLEHLLAQAPDAVVSADLSCLMHLKGLSDRAGRPLRPLHVAQVLLEARANRAV